MASKALTGVLLAALVSGAGVWVVWARQVTTESQVIELIETRSPYREDRKELAYRMEEQTERSKDLEKSVRNIERELVEMKAVLQAILKKLDENGKGKK